MVYSHCCICIYDPLEFSWVWSRSAAAVGSVRRTPDVFHILQRTPELFRRRLCFSVLASRLLHCMGNTQLCKLYDFTKIKMFECKKYLEKSSMFHEDVFTVVVQRRPVAAACRLVWIRGRPAATIQFGRDWMGFISFEKNIKISFVNSSVSVVLFSQSSVKAQSAQGGCFFIFLKLK